MAKIFSVPCLCLFPIGSAGLYHQFNVPGKCLLGAASIEILDTKNEVEDKPNAKVLPEIQGNVKFDDVVFRYFKGGEPVLNHVSFDAPAGQTIALLGATGSGKTTIINLIPRFYDVSEGRVLVDGNDVRDVTLESLRSQHRYRPPRDNLVFGQHSRQYRVWQNRCDDGAGHLSGKGSRGGRFHRHFPAGL